MTSKDKQINQTELPEIQKRNQEERMSIPENIQPEEPARSAVVVQESARSAGVVQESARSAGVVQESARSAVVVQESAQSAVVVQESARSAVVVQEPASSAGVVHEPGLKPAVPVALRWLSYLVLVPMMLLATVLFGLASLLAGLWDKDGSEQHAIARLWANVLLKVALSPVTVEGYDRLLAMRDGGGGVGAQAAVYVANHLSYFDTPVVFAWLPFQFRILAKAPLWKIPFIGWYLNRSGQVPVDQTSARSAVASLGRGVRTLESGMPLFVFPEGGRAFNGELQKMVSGAAWMAIKAQVPLVPLTLIGTYELLPIHVYALRPRPLKMVVGEPISTLGMTTRDADALTQRVHDEIYKTYTKGQ
jgi:1-acyl-sn-glycerol-3-phosphate acyltransferase